MEKPKITTILDMLREEQYEATKEIDKIATGKILELMVLALGIEKPKKLNKKVIPLKR